jgi:hypothetical protein
MIIREGSCRVPEACNSGANLRLVSNAPISGNHNSLLRQQKHTTNIQIQNLCTRMIRRILEGRAPSRSCICNKNIELSFLLLNRLHQTDNLCFAGDIGWNSDRAAFDSSQLVKFYDRLVNSLRSSSLSRSDDNFLCSCSKECCRCVKPKSARSCSDFSALLRVESVRGCLPPVMRATLPSKRNMRSKSRSSDIVILEGGASPIAFSKELR